MKREAPLGVKILAGLFYFSLAWYFLGLGVVLQRWSYISYYAPWMGLLIILTTILLLAGAVIWYGLLKLNPTAWKIAVALFSLSVLTNLIIR